MRMVNVACFGPRGVEFYSFRLFMAEPKANSGGAS